ncbi:MAG TPA: GAF and ANTAR domain-containing protein [Acidimicrobiales bacterium]|nr:GAF and ANTAR domain-containing protein [Acidimicrobiales bacterium]
MRREAISVSSDPAIRALRALSQFLVAERSMGETLQRVSEIVIDALPAARTAGISMLSDDGTPTTGVFTDEQAPEIDAAQYDAGRGPCLDAWRQRRVVVLNDFDQAADDYPEFVREARAHGVGSVLSLPLVAGDSGLGALNLYAPEGGTFSSRDQAVGGALAAAAAIVLANASAYWEVSQLSEQLTEAMRSRAVIEQAKGMLMARSPQLSADDAFDLLRRASQRENVKLRDIAQRIVDRKPGSFVDDLR